MLESAQGSLIKQCIGLSKRSHHTALLRALYIDPISDVVKRDTISLAGRLSQVQSPLRNLFTHEISSYILEGKIHKNCIVDRLLRYGISPVSILFSDGSRGSCPPYDGRGTVEDGIADSLRPLLTSPNYNNPASFERSLVKLLTRVNE